MVPNRSRLKSGFVAPCLPRPTNPKWSSARPTYERSCSLPKRRMVSLKQGIMHHLWALPKIEEVVKGDRCGDCAAPSHWLAVTSARLPSFLSHCAWQRTLFVICSEHPVVEHLRRMTRARPLLDPFAQGRILSAPYTLAPLQCVNQYPDRRCKQLCRSCLAGVRPDHPRSCDRQFLPMPFRQLGALSQCGALLRSLTAELVWRSDTMRKSTAILTSQAPFCGS
jgi:hypothetical protein